MLHTHRHASCNGDVGQQDVKETMTADQVSRARTIAETALFWTAYPTAPARHVNAWHLRQRQNMNELMEITATIPDCAGKKKLLNFVKKKSHPVRLNPMRRVLEAIANELRNDIKSRLSNALSVTSYQDDSISIKQNVYRALGFSWNEPGVGFVIRAVKLFDVTNNKTGAQSAESFRQCLTQFGIPPKEKLANSVTDGGSNMCEVTGPVESMNAVLLIIFAYLATTWCICHVYSLGLGDVLTSSLCRGLLDLIADIQSLFRGNGAEGAVRELRKACEDVLDRCAYSRISSTVGRKRQLRNYDSSRWKSFFEAVTRMLSLTQPLKLLLHRSGKTDLLDRLNRWEPRMRAISRCGVIFNTVISKLQTLTSPIAHRVGPWSDELLTELYATAGHRVTQTSSTPSQNWVIPLERFHSLLGSADANRFRWTVDNKSGFPLQLCSLHQPAGNASCMASSTGL